MAFVTDDPTEFLGESVGSGQCVAYVQAVAKAPLTKEWKAGQVVKGAEIPAGTAIACFDPNGEYGNHTDGRSHAAIYLEQDASGIYVMDQWEGQVVHRRILRFQGETEGIKPCNNGDCFAVIEGKTAD